MDASGIYIMVSPEDPSHSEELSKESKLITDEDRAELMHVHVCIFRANLSTKGEAHHDAHQGSC